MMTKATTMDLELLDKRVALHQRWLVGLHVDKIARTGSLRISILDALTNGYARASFNVLVAMRDAGILEAKDSLIRPSSDQRIPDEVTFAFAPSLDKDALRVWLSLWAGQSIHDPFWMSD